MTTKTNFECMLCDYKSSVKLKGYHLGICKKCINLIKTSWPDKKDVIVVSDNKPVK